VHSCADDQSQRDEFRPSVVLEGDQQTVDSASAERKEIYDIPHKNLTAWEESALREVLPLSSDVATQPEVRSLLTHRWDHLLFLRSPAVSAVPSLPRLRYERRHRRHLPAHSKAVRNQAQL